MLTFADPTVVAKKKETASYNDPMIDSDPEHVMYTQSCLFARQVDCKSKV